MFEGTYVHDLKYLHPFIIYYTYTKYEFVCREDSTDWLVSQKYNSPRVASILAVLVTRGLQKYKYFHIALPLIRSYV